MMTYQNHVAHATHVTVQHLLHAQSCSIFERSGVEDILVER